MLGCSLATTVAEKGQFVGQADVQKKPYTAEDNPGTLAKPAAKPGPRPSLAWRPEIEIRPR